MEGQSLDLFKWDMQLSLAYTQTDTPRSIFTSFFIIALTAFHPRAPRFYFKVTFFSPLYLRTTFCPSVPNNYTIVRNIFKLFWSTRSFICVQIIPFLPGCGKHAVRSSPISRFALVAVVTSWNTGNDERVKGRGPGAKWTQTRPPKQAHAESSRHERLITCPVASKVPFGARCIHGQAQG